MHIFIMPSQCGISYSDHNPKKLFQSLECEDSDLSLIHLADRGGLKYPSNEVF